MGCLTVIVSRVGSGVNAVYTMDGTLPEVSYTLVGKDLSAAFLRQDAGLSADYTRAGGMKARFGLVCGTNLGEGYLFASDALLITIENGKLIVKQR